ncbi:MAG: hypothetical protein ABSH16_02100 [Sedimentisphaerales bacterium]
MTEDRGRSEAESRSAGQKTEDRRPRTVIRHLLSVLKWAGFCLIIGGIATHILIKLWLGPAYVSEQTKLALAEFWMGPVRVEKVDFHYNGVMHLRDIIFYDRAGAVGSTGSPREVMKAGGIELTLGEWPSLTAPARRIEIDRLDVRIRLEKGPDMFGIPIRFGESFNTEQSILEHFRIKELNVTVESNEASFALDRMFIEINKSRDNYALYVGSSGESGFKLRGKGLYNTKSSDIEMNLKFAQQAPLDETKVLLSLIPGRPGETWGCRGNIEANLGVKGNLSDTNTLWPEGTITFDNWTILVNQKTAAEGINGVLAVNKRRFELEQATGTLCKGQLRLSLVADINEPRLAGVTYSGNVMAVDVNLAELTGLTETTKRLERGTGLMRLEFSGKTPDIKDLNGQGVILIDEADLWRVPVIGKLFASIGVMEESFGEMSDAEFEFRLSGTKLIIERGRLSNGFSAIEAEKGGTINLRNGQLDLYVVAMPVKEIDRIINRAPVIRWFAHFKNKLVRLHLKGHWSEPTRKLIHKQPMRDIGEGTIGFFMDVLESGGHIAERAKQELGIGKQQGGVN